MDTLPGESLTSGPAARAPTVSPTSMTSRYTMISRRIALIGLMAAAAPLSGCVMRLPTNSVARAAYAHDLTLPELQRWWPVFEPLMKQAATDSALRERLKFPFDSSLASQVHLVDTTPAIAATLPSAHLSSQDFVLITRIFIDAAMTMTDSTPPPPSRRASTVNPANYLFLQQHRAALNALLGPR